MRFSNTLEMTSYFDIFMFWEGWIYLLILSILEIVLGIDNILFISIITDDLEPKAQKKARNIGSVSCMRSETTDKRASLNMSAMDNPIFLAFF